MMNQLTKITRQSTRTLAISYQSARGIKTEEHAKYFVPIKTPMLPPDTFKGQVAFITGGGTGLGKGMAEMLSKLGANIFITSRKQDVLEKASADIMSKYGNKVAYCAADVRNVDQVKESVKACETSLGLPSLVINNAAGNFISPTERLSANAIKSVVDIVLMGTLNTTLILGKRLIEEKKRASFLSILTTYINHGSGYTVPSAAAKAGVAAMTKSLACEWAKYGLRFNGVSPGAIYTKGAWSRLDPTGSFIDKVSKRIAVGRMGEPEELANLVSYVLSDYASWLNGEIISLDGGEMINMAGQFNILSMVTKEQWDMMEKMIKSVK